MQATLYADNSMILALSGVKDHNGTSITTATVTATLSRAGTQVWTGTLTADGAGGYEAAVPYDLEVTPGERLAGEIVAVSGGLRMDVAVTIHVRERV